MRVCTPTEFLAAGHIERRKLVLAQIEATPEAHRQGIWLLDSACGTHACIAGWAALLAGADPDWDEDSRRAHQVWTDQGRANVPLYAQGLLGLTPGETDDLFWEASASTAVEKLRAYCE